MASAADLTDNVAAPAGRKAHERLSEKDLFGPKGSVTGGHSTAAMKAKQVCDFKRKAEDQVAQVHTKQRRMDAHAVSIVLADYTVETLKGKAPWTTALIENLGMKALADLIVRKGAKTKPKGK